PMAPLPHARAVGRAITEGDLIVLDFGGVYDSYCVDLTRTVSVGPAFARAREVFAAVNEARERPIASVAPGRSRFEIDEAARQTLEGYGLGEAFGHGTGHGLGIEVHEDPRHTRRRAGGGTDGRARRGRGVEVREDPRLTRRRPDVDSEDEAVAAGMIFTIEPGAYLPGWGGVRIEDDVLVTHDGVEVLTGVTTELIEI